MVGCELAVKVKQELLYRIIALLLVVIAIVLLFGHDTATSSGPPLTGVALFMAGATAGLVIGVVASLLGVAGGELLIPTFVLLFGAETRRQPVSGCEFTDHARWFCPLQP